MRFPQSTYFFRVICLQLGLLLFLGSSIPLMGQTRTRPRPTSSVDQAPATRIPGPYKSREDNGPFSRIVLQNDLILLIKGHDAFPLASLTVRIQWPAMPSTAENELLMRLAAAYLFDFTETSNAAKPFGPIETLGGIIQTKISPESLLWTVTVPAESLSSVYPLVARRLRPRVVTPAELTTILQELSQNLSGSSSEHDSRDLFLLAGFPTSTEIPSEATPTLSESLSSFLKQMVIASQMTLSVVGDIDRERTIQRVAEQFLSIPGGAAKPLSKTSASETNGLHYFTVPSPDGLAHVSLFFSLPSTQFPAAVTLGALLTQGEMSLLHQTLHRSRNLVTAVDSRVLWLNKQRILSVRFDCLKENIDEAAVFLFSRLQQLRSTVPSTDEILRARQQFVLNRYLDYQEPAGVGIELAEFEARSEFNLYPRMLREVEKVTAEEVHKAAVDCLTLDHMVVVEEWPRGSEKRPFTTASYREFLSLTLPRTLSKIGKKPEQASANLPAIPEQQTIYSGNLDRSQLKPSGWKKYSILRGPDVYVNEFHLTPLVTIAALYAGGSLVESSDSQAGYTALATRAALQATKNRTHDELWFNLEAMGATLVPITREDLFGYVLQVPSNAAPPAIDLLLDILLDPPFSPDNVRVTKAQLILEWRSQLESPQAFAEDQLMSTFFSQTSLYPPLSKRIESAKKTTEKDIAAWWNKMQKETPPVLIIFGDTEGTELVASFARKLSSSRWKSSVLQSITNFKTPKLPALINARLAFLPTPQFTVGFGGPNFSVASAEALDVGRWLFKDLFRPSQVYGFHYLRYFTGEIRLRPDGAPLIISRVSKEISSLVSTDAALAAAQKMSKTDRELVSARPIDKILALFRRTVYLPTVEAITQIEQEASQMTLAQLKEALSAIFNLQTLLVCQVSP